MLVRVSVCAYAGFVLGGERPQHLRLQQGSNWTASCLRIVYTISCPDHQWFYSWYVCTYVRTYVCLATSFRTATRGWVYIRAYIAARTTKFHVLQFVTSHKNSSCSVLIVPCREGTFGACFFPVPASGVTKIYAARPGGRVWEAGLDGKVVATHKLKDLLSVPPSPLLGCRCVHTALPSDCEQCSPPM